MDKNKLVMDFTGMDHKEVGELRDNNNKIFSACLSAALLEKTSISEEDLYGFLNNGISGSIASKSVKQLQEYYFATKKKDYILYDKNMEQVARIIQTVEDFLNEKYTLKGDLIELSYFMEMNELQLAVGKRSEQGCFDFSHVGLEDNSIVLIFNIIDCTTVPCRVKTAEEIYAKIIKECELSPKETAVKKIEFSFCWKNNSLWCMEESEVRYSSKNGIYGELIKFKDGKIFERYLIIYRHTIKLSLDYNRVNLEPFLPLLDLVRDENVRFELLKQYEQISQQTPLKHTSYSVPPEIQHFVDKLVLAVDDSIDFSIMRFLLFCEPHSKRAPMFIAENKQWFLKERCRKYSHNGNGCFNAEYECAPYIS